ncbi:MAG: TIGR02147 family protein [Bdellovibrio sp.]|nr:MAG: TIGR02147 family protein [Bdellovibrio sp.]
MELEKKRSSVKKEAQAIKSLQPPNLSEHTDFRKYLKEFYEYKQQESKNHRRPYTYAHFSAAANIKSPNYLKLIIEGQRNLSETMMTRFAKALKLDKSQTEEWKVLVRYGQAEDPLERNQHLRHLASIRNKRKVPKNQDKHDHYTWVMFALHALADQEGAAFTVGELRELLQNRASQKEIRASLEHLVKTGELIRDPDTGEIKKGKTLSNRAEPIPPEVVRRLQAELIYLGMESLMHGSPRDREFGSVTVALTEKEYEELRFELRHLRKRIYKDILMAREKTKGDRVFQLNFQLFPITKKSGQKKTS